MAIDRMKKWVIGAVAFAVISGSAWAEPAAVISKLGYSVQVGAFANVDNAERLASKLQDKGIEAYYFKKENNVFAVRFGNYATRKEAKNAARELTAAKLVEAYYIASPLRRDIHPLNPVAHDPAAVATVDADPAKPAAVSNETPVVTSKPIKKPKKNNEMGEIAAKTAERFVGIPYKWGGNTVVEGLDCSAFVKSVYYLCGINIPRTSAEQFKVGQRVPQEELTDGDLVFFGHNNQVSHVGIYIGQGKFVHAPKRNDEIKIAELARPGFTKKYLGARRYF
jgi:cell wall-associated NlpC family hydrolase